MNNDILKCKDNIFDLAKFTYVQNKDGIVRLSTRGYQRKVLTLMQLPPICGNKTNIILKQPRQSGSTAETLLFLMHRFLFEPYSQICIVSTSIGRSSELIAKLKLALENLPKEWFDNGLDISFTKTIIKNNTNHARIVATSYRSIDSIRSLTINYMYLDDFAFAHKSEQDDVCKAFFPVMLSRAANSTTDNSKIIISSATNGKDNAFYKLCVEAMGAKSSFLLVEIPWWDVYNFNVKEMKTRAEQIGARAWMREYGLFFDDYDE